VTTVRVGQSDNAVTEYGSYYLDTEPSWTDTGLCVVCSACWQLGMSPRMTVLLWFCLTMLVLARTILFTVALTVGLSIILYWFSVF